MLLQINAYCYFETMNLSLYIRPLRRYISIFIFFYFLYFSHNLRISDNGGPGQRLLAWNVPQSELIHIPEHWLTYPEPEMSLHLLLGLLYIFFFVMALIGNGLVLWVFSA